MNSVMNQFQKGIHIPFFSPLSPFTGSPFSVGISLDVVIVALRSVPFSDALLLLDGPALLGSGTTTVTGFQCLVNNWIHSLTTLISP